MGCFAGVFELEFVHEFDFATRWHQPNARTDESLRPRRLLCRGLPSPPYRRAAARLECGATVAHAFVGGADIHALAQSARDTTARASRVAAFRPVAAHPAHRPDAP